MEHEDLMKSMDEGVEEKKAEFRKKAEEAAKAIRCDAKTRAAEIKKARLDAAVTAMKAERNRAFYTAKNEMGKELTAAKYRLFDQAFQEAGKALAGARSDGRYPACYQQLTAEALGELDDPAGVLHIDPRDGDVCRQALAGLGASREVMPDLRCTGGLDARSRDGKVVVSNTIEARMEKAKDRLKLDVFAALFGD